ncbi:MAG: hypothetical protein HY013_08910 [Candidatus Solibacter usitatus]|nr:hypothetical protein [Candidatus Solibacter usitatus]
MACYISSNANRLYTKTESAYGQTPAITASHRFPAVKLATKQQVEAAERRDKTGSRTFAGVPAGSRRRTSFELKTYLTNWNLTGEPGYGPLFRASLGGAPLSFNGGTVGAGSTATLLVFATAHGLAAKQAVTVGGELRFVSAVVDPVRVQLNAPLSVTPGVGAPVGKTVTYLPQLDLESVSVFDYWTPATAVQRILCGAAMDRMRILVNGDYHEFEFSGAAQDLIDSASFTSGQGQLTSFPSEPAAATFDYTIVPGHLGQAWLGSAPDRFYTITSASVLLDNDIELRAREFGSSLPRCVAPGRRSVTAEFDLYEQDDAATQGLYQAARAMSPIAAMFQLGQAPGQMCGVYLPKVTPETPSFDDGERRVAWRFGGARAQGAGDDEVVVAFG